MTQPAELPLVGKFKLTLVGKEQLLEFWTDAQKRNGLELPCEGPAEAVTREGEVLNLRITRGELRACTVLLSVGRRGTPRKLGGPGEQLAKIVYRLIEEQQYTGQRVLVVGGGNSALGVAARLAKAGVAAALSYRRDEFQRVKPATGSASIPL